MTGGLALVSVTLRPTHSDIERDIPPSTVGVCSRNADYLLDKGNPFSVPANSVREFITGRRPHVSSGEVSIALRNCTLLDAGSGTCTMRLRSAGRAGVVARSKGKPALIETLKELVEIESGSRDLEGLNRIANVIAARLRALGGTVEVIEPNSDVYKMSDAREDRKDGASDFFRDR